MNDVRTIHSLRYIDALESQVAELRAELRQRDDRIDELCRIIERAGQPFIDEANRVVPKETT